MTQRRTTIITALIFISVSLGFFVSTSVGRAASQQTVAAAGQPSTATSYSPVTFDDLLHPSDANWLLPRRTYAGTGFSPLAQINSSNVKNLVPVWSFPTGVKEGHEAPPMVNDGVMFVATPSAQLLAFNAKTGKLLWRFKHPTPADQLLIHPTSRGVGLLGNMVYFATPDAHLIALDARTGKVMWDTTVANYADGYYITLAPLVVKDKVVLGCSGGETGIRGFLAAYDAKTGNQAWRIHTVPKPTAKGGNTWQGNAWEHGGAPVWITGTYDPKLDLMYWGTGNPTPWLPDERGTNNDAALYSDSVIAVKPETGEMVAYYQYNHDDAWDWDEVDAPILATLQRDGKTMETLIHPGRDGYLWTLSRDPNSIKYVSAWKFVNGDVVTGVDPTTGRLSYDQKYVPKLSNGPDKPGNPTKYCPSAWGGKNWFAAAYDPHDQMLYTPANNNLCSVATAVKPKYVAGQPYVGEGIDDLVLALWPGATHIGELQAWDMNTGKRVWTHDFVHSHNFGPVLATGGGLLFEGGTNDRMFRAFDAKTGHVLWSTHANSGFIGAPVAFMVDGKEYIAVQSGWGVDAERVQTSLNRHVPSYTEHVPQGGTVWVFALKS